MKALLTIAFGSMALASMGVHAATIVVNVEAGVDYRNGAGEYTLGEEVPLAAGSYLVYSMSRADGPQYLYDAWNYGFSGYLNQYFIHQPDNGSTVFNGTLNAAGTNWKIFATPDEALAVARSTFSPYRLELGASQTVRFGIADSFYGDNSGGISLEVVAVPEPETYALVALGLVAVGWAARRARADTGNSRRCTAP